jgi:hypothetical protein
MGASVTAVEGATFVPRFLDGSLHTPQRDDAYVHVRLPEPPEQAGAVTVYLPDGTALVVSRRDLVRLAAADEPQR